MKDSFIILSIKREEVKKKQKLANYKFYTICALFGRVPVNGYSWTIKYCKLSRD